MSSVFSALAAKSVVSMGSLTYINIVDLRMLCIGPWSS